MSDMHIIKVIREIQKIMRQSEILTMAIWRDPALEDSLRREVSLIVIRIQETVADVLEDIADVLKKYHYEVHDDN